MLEIVSEYALSGGDREIVFSILEDDSGNVFLQYVTPWGEDRTVCCVDFSDCFIKMNYWREILGGRFYVINGGL